MTKPKINPAAVGVFIAGAIVILFASVLVFGSGRFFRKTKDLLLTFNEPVTGLDVGAPVKLMGVSIGSVKDVMIEVGPDLTNNLLISVVVQIDRDHARAVFRDFPIEPQDRPRFDQLINERGLRGQLEVLSLLSGQLYVALDMFPGKAGFRLNNQPGYAGMWEVPTLPSTKRQLVHSVLTSLENLTAFDFKGTSVELKGLLTDLRGDLAGMQLDTVGTNLSHVLSEARTLLANPELRGAVTNLNAALVQVRDLGGNLNAKLNPLLAEAGNDLKKAGALFDETARTLRQLQAQIEPGSTLSRELVRTLDAASVTLNALRQLAQEIQRNPSSLITGKKEPQP